MFLDIHDLERDPIDFEEHLAPGLLDLGPEVSQAEPLDISGTAELLRDEIRINGSLHTVVQVSCARCLEPATIAVDRQFDLFYRPLTSIARSEEIEIKSADMEIGFYEGDGIQLEEAIKEQILLSLPMKSICRPDCAGLCPQCGQNRNLGECRCGDSSPRDSRWAPLAGLK